MNNHNTNHKKININNKTKFIEKEKLNFPKKESSACLLSQLNSILKEIKENFKKNYEENKNLNDNIIQILEDLLKDITDMEKLEQIKRRKHVCKQVPK